MRQNAENTNGRVCSILLQNVTNLFNIDYLSQVGDGQTYFERGCAVHGEVSRREGRNCIERVG